MKELSMTPGAIYTRNRRAAAKAKVAIPYGREKEPHYNKKQRAANKAIDNAQSPAVEKAMGQFKAKLIDIKTTPLNRARKLFAAKLAQAFPVKKRRRRDNYKSKGHMHYAELLLAYNDMLGQRTSYVAEMERLRAENDANRNVIDHQRAAIEGRDHAYKALTNDLQQMAKGRTELTIQLASAHAAAKRWKFTAHFMVGRSVSDWDETL